MAFPFPLFLRELYPFFSYRYGVPEELDATSEAFTMIYFLWGTSLIAACHLVATTSVVREYSHNNLDSRSQRMFYTDTTDISADCLQLYGLKSSKRRFHERHKVRFIIALMSISWAIIGTCYGMWFERWSFVKSLYFAIGAMSAAGVPVPRCIDGDDERPLATCRLGGVRGYALGVYLIVGVPLFAFTVGHLSGYFVDAIAHANYQRLASKYVCAYAPLHIFLLLPFACSVSGAPLFFCLSLSTFPFRSC